MRPRILVVDDQVAIGTYIRAVAEPLGYEVTIATEPRKAMPLVIELAPALIILDIVMPQMDGIEILRALGAMRCAAHILIISGFSADYLESAASLSKPFGLEHVSTMPKPFRTAALRQYLAQSVPVPPA